MNNNNENKCQFHKLVEYIPDCVFKHIIADSIIKLLTDHIENPRLINNEENYCDIQLNNKMITYSVGIPDIFDECINLNKEDIIQLIEKAFRQYNNATVCIVANANFNFKNITTMVVRKIPN